MRLDINRVTPKVAYKTLRDYFVLLKPGIVQQLINVVSTSAKWSINTLLCCSWLSPEQVEQLTTTIAADQKWSRWAFVVKLRPIPCTKPTTKNRNRREK